MMDIVEGVRRILVDSLPRLIPPVSGEASGESGLPSPPLILGISGGADSVALLRILHTLRYRVIAVHCNFGLRGTESDRDETFTRQLCEEAGVPLKVFKFDVPAFLEEHPRTSVEMACRTLRYDVLKR